MKIFTLLLLAFLIGFATPLLAVDLYTSSTGSDTANNCRTMASPCDLSNGLAYEMANITPGNGDHLYMCAGACNGSGSATITATIDANDYRIPSGTSFSNAMTVQSYPGESVTFRPAGCGAVVNIVNDITYTIWKDFVVDGSDCLATYRGYDPVDQHFLGGVASDGISVGYGSHHNRFQNIEVKNTGGNGVIVQNIHGDSSFNEFINMNVHHNARTGYGHGAYIADSNTLIDGGEWHHMTGPYLRNYGISVYLSGSSVINNNIVRNTRIYDNAKGLILASGRGNIAYNNLIYNNPQEGVQFDYGQSGTKFFYNLVYGTTNNNAANVVTGSAPEIRNNIFWGNGSNRIDGSATASHNLTSNPMFVDQAGQNFRLQAGSPAIQAGISVPEVQVDMMGTPRIGVPDIGAFQSGSGSSAVPPPPPTSGVPAAPTNLRVQEIH